MVPLLIIELVCISFLIPISIGLQCSDDSQCPDHSTTCCPTQDGSYGCCPIAHAVCCDDHINCCPHGSTCDSASRTCRLAFGGTQRITEMFASKKNDYIECPDATKCRSVNTCCELKSGKYGCCPLTNAVCCDDKVHCCPYGQKCAAGGSRCVSVNENLELHSFDSLAILHSFGLPAMKRHQHQKRIKSAIRKIGSLQKCTADTFCTESSKCCNSEASANCCPFKDGVCCFGGDYCCPQGFQCLVDTKECIRDDGREIIELGATRTTKSELYERFTMCDANIFCGADETCCKEYTGNTKFSCCSLTNGSCCRESCCPKNYYCMNGGKCKKRMDRFLK